MKKFIAIAGLIFLVGVVVAIGVVNSRYGLVFAAPRVSHEDVLTFHPSVRITLDPEKIKALIVDMAAEALQREIPDWAVDRVMPYEGALVLGANHDDSIIQVMGFLNPQRLGPVIVELFNKAQLLDEASEIEWSPRALVRVEPGALILTGTFPMESEAEEDSWIGWSHTLPPSPIPLEGGHLLEAVLDNRDGGAYVSLLSLLHAYNFQMNEETKGIVLGTVRNALSVRLYLDMPTSDVLLMHLAIEIKPANMKRLAVANMKGGLDEFFEITIERLQNDHGLEIEGKVRWNDNVLEYDYRLSNPRKVIDLLLKGELL